MFLRSFLPFLFSENTVHSSNVCPEKMGEGRVVYFQWVEYLWFFIIFFFFFKNFHFEMDSSVAEISEICRENICFL